MVVVNRAVSGGFVNEAEPVASHEPPVVTAEPAVVTSATLPLRVTSIAAGQPYAAALAVPRGVQGTSAAVPIAASAPPTLPTFMAVGDSIAALLVKDHLANGTMSAENTPPDSGSSTQDGRTPHDVLDWIKLQPPGTFRRQSIVLSTGATNTLKPGIDDKERARQMPLINDQIAALYADGAASVTVLGVGVSIPHHADLDRQLREAVDRSAATGRATSYTGPLQGTAGGRWHPKEPAATLQQAQTAYKQQGA